MVEIGNFAYATMAQQALDSQNNPRLTWDYIIHEYDMKYSRINQGVKTVGYSIRYNPSDFKWTDFTNIQNAIDVAKSKAQYFNYGVYMFNEELASPITSANWFGSKQSLATWVIDGSMSFGGQTIELMRTWATRVYGSWDSNWWSSTVSSNNLNDSKVKAWNEYYTLQLLKAWKGLMVSLGKGCATMISGLNTTMTLAEFLKAVYTPAGYDYILNNYDIITSYRDPNTLGATNLANKIISTTVSESDIKSVRPYFKGKIIHQLTVCWPDGWGCPWSEAVAFDEYKRVKAAGADVIGVPPTGTWANWNPNEIPYIPYLLKFYDATGGGGGITASINTNKSTYNPSELSTVTWAGAADRWDWIGLYNQSNPTSAIETFYLNGNNSTPPATIISSGSLQRTLPANAGTYVYRLINGITLALRAESLPFIIAGCNPSPCSFNVIQVN